MAQTIQVRISFRARHSYRRGYPPVTRNRTNLIRIQTKSAKIKQVLPNILSLNVRSILKKLKIWAHVIHNYISDIVMVSETWLSDDIPDEALHFPGISGLSVVRNYRVNKRGGGVAVFIKDTIPFKLCHDFISQDHECLWIILRPKWLPRSISKLALACAYLPPSLDSGATEDFYDYFCNCYDMLTSDSPNIAIVADFNPVGNGFQEKIIINHCQLKQIVRRPTRGTAILDLNLNNAYSFYEKPNVLLVAQTILLLNGDRRLR